MKTETYTRKVLPHLKPEYFRDENDRTLFQLIADFREDYNTAPTYDALDVEIDSLSIPDDAIKEIKKTVEEIKTDQTTTTHDWLIDATEKFCKHQSCYLGIMKSVEILNGKSSLKEDAMLDLMKDALAVSFDTNVGHDFLEQFTDRFDYYHAVEEKIPFDLDFFNIVTKGGVSKGTLNVILAGTGVGKSLAMCHFAAAALSAGKNVLYITLELADKEVAKRIDANLMDTTIDDLLAMPKSVYDQKASVLKAKTNGKLIIKQYPTASASVSHFRALLSELLMKKNFTPDIVFIDYLNICVSSRLKRGMANSYDYIKAIAEEIRGLAGEFNLPIITATQTNRSGFSSSDVSLEDTSESFGLPATADFMFALITSEQLDACNRLMVKQLKNRYNDPTVNKRFVVGLDRRKMKLFDVDMKEQTDLVDANIKTTQTAKPVQNIVVSNTGYGVGPSSKFQGLKVS